MAGRAELDRGRGLRAKCKLLSKTTWNITNADKIIQLKMPFKDLREVLFLSYEENMISDEELLLLYDEYSSKNPEFEPLVSIWELAFWSPWPQLKNVLTCAVAVMLQKYFRLASVVPRTSDAWVPSWRASTKILNWFHWRKHLPIRYRYQIFLYFGNLCYTRAYSDYVRKYTPDFSQPSSARFLHYDCDALLQKF